MNVATALYSKAPLSYSYEIVIPISDAPPLLKAFGEALAASVPLERDRARLEFYSDHILQPQKPVLLANLSKAAAQGIMQGVAVGRGKINLCGRVLSRDLYEHDRLACSWHFSDESMATVIRLRASDTSRLGEAPFGMVLHDQPLSCEEQSENMYRGVDALFEIASTPAYQEALPQHLESKTRLEVLQQQKGVMRQQGSDDQALRRLTKQLNELEVVKLPDEMILRVQIACDVADQAAMKSFIAEHLTPGGPA